MQDRCEVRGASLLIRLHIEREYTYTTDKQDESETLGFKVSLFKEKLDADKVTDNQKKIIEIIIGNNKATTNNLALEVGISQRKIKENIQKLKEKGILQRSGPAKGGYWKILRHQ